MKSVRPAGRTRKPDVSIRPLQEKDIPFAVKITAGQGWDFVKKDFVRLLELTPGGSFVAFSGGRRVGLTTTLCHRNTGWIGSVVVSPGYRGLGIGRALVLRALLFFRRHGKKREGLLSVPDYTDFYGGMGFASGQKVVRFAGRLRRRGVFSHHGDVVSISEKILGEVISLDEMAFGDDRSALLRRLARDYPNHFLVLRKNEKTLGYLVGKKGIGTTELGPWVIRKGHRDGARSLLYSMLYRLHGRVELYISAKKMWALSLLTGLGLKRDFTYIEMERGNRRHGSCDIELLCPAGLEKG